MRNLYSVLIALAFGCGLTIPDEAAEPIASPGPTQATTNAAIPAASRPAVIRQLDFEGGPVRLLIERLQEAGRRGQLPLPALNVVASDDMKDEYVPRFELRNVTYGDVFEALNLLNGPRSPARWQLSSSAGGEPVWVLVSPLTGGQQIDPMTGLPQPSSASPQHCEIYQLQRFLAKYNVDDITTAIQTAWTMIGVERGAQLKYHKDTSLLIAVGRPAQLEVIARVLRSLDEGLAASGANRSDTTDELFPQGNKSKDQLGEIYVKGAVNKPGSVALRSDETLDILGALLRAGGLSVRASDKVKFTRPGSAERTFRFEDLKKGRGESISLKPGDLIEVQERLF